MIKWTESSERRQEEKMEVSEATATSTVTTESTVTSERHGNTQKQAQPSQEQCPQQVVQKQQQGGSSASTSSNIPGWIDQQYDLVLIVRFHHVGMYSRVHFLLIKCHATCWTTNNASHKLLHVLFIFYFNSLLPLLALSSPSPFPVLFSLSCSLLLRLSS